MDKRTLAIVAASLIGATVFILWVPVVSPPTIVEPAEPALLSEIGTAISLAKWYQAWRTQILVRRSRVLDMHCKGKSPGAILRTPGYGYAPKTSRKIIRRFGHESDCGISEPHPEPHERQE